MFRYLPVLMILTLSLPLPSEGADLRVGLTRYEGGAATYGVGQNQQLICDNCPSGPELVLAPPRPVIRYEPPREVEPLLVSELPKESLGEQPGEGLPVSASSNRINVFFSFDKAHLTAEEKKKIREALAGGLDPDVVVRVGGYTCRVGTEAYNRKLSARRAKAVAAYLRGLGVKVSIVKGLGKRHHQGAVIPKDRRAEILIKERN